MRTTTRKGKPDKHYAERWEMFKKEMENRKTLPTGLIKALAIKYGMYVTSINRWWRDYQDPERRAHMDKIYSTGRSKQEAVAVPVETKVEQVMTSPSQIADALLQRVVVALRNNDLKDEQLKEAKKRIAQLEEIGNRLHDEQDRLLKIHNQQVRTGNITSSDELVRLARLDGLGKVKHEE